MTIQARLGPAEGHETFPRSAFRSLLSGLAARWVQTILWMSAVLRGKEAGAVPLAVLPILLAACSGQADPGVIAVFDGDPAVVTFPLPAGTRYQLWYPCPP